MSKRNYLILVLLLIVEIVLSIVEIVHNGNGGIREIPLVEATVVGLDYEKDLVTIQDKDGHLWQFAECEDWMVGDHVRITPIYTGYEK